MEEGQLEEGEPPGTEEGATDGTIRARVNRGRIVAGIAALGGLAMALGAVLPWATATVRGTGERSGQRIVVNAPGNWPSLGLIVVAIGLGTVIVWASRAFSRPSSVWRRVAAGCLCIAAGLAAVMIFPLSSLDEMVPSIFPAAPLDCYVYPFADPCTAIDVAPGFRMIALGGLTAALFGGVAVLRSIPDRRVLIVILIVLGAISLALFILTLSEMDTL